MDIFHADRGIRSEEMTRVSIDFSPLDVAPGLYISCKQMALWREEQWIV